MTLDGVERTLATADGVDRRRATTPPIGLAGVMGGASTEISDATTAVVLELAWWDPMTIARTSKRLNLRSEASARFERGTDPEIVELAARRFAELLGADRRRGSPAERRRRAGRPARRRPRFGCAPTGSTPCSAPSSTAAADHAACSTRSASTVRPTAATTAPSDVTVPSFRPDTTHRDRRDRGGRPPLRLRQHRPRPCRRRSRAGLADRLASSTGARSAR